VATAAAYPASWSGDVTTVSPGGAFGFMGIANFEATYSAACAIDHDIPWSGYNVGTEYTFTISTDVANGLGMVWKVGSIAQSNSGTGPASKKTTHEVKWTPTAQTEDSVQIHAICGKGGGTMNVAQSVHALKSGTFQSLETDRWIAMPDANAAASGTVSLYFQGTNAFIQGLPLTADPLCASSGPSSAPNSCGIHIHSGFTCDMVGGHHYAGAADPWVTVVYGASDLNLQVDTGLDFIQNIGRVLVVHNQAGDKIACAPLGANTVKNAAYASNTVEWGGMSWNEYPAYAGYTPGKFDVRSSSFEVQPTISSNVVRLSWNNLYADPACVNGANSSAANSCGIHIHAGESCASHDVVQGHYYVGTTDPWTAVGYSGYPSEGSVYVDIGVAYATAWNRAIVVHDHTGARIACQLLYANVPSSLEGRFPVTYFNYNGDLKLNADARVQLDFIMEEHVTVSFTDLGGDIRCDGNLNASSANSCGVHIHTGFDCTADASGHYFNSNNVADPWNAQATYSSDSGMFTLRYGYPLRQGTGDSFGRTIIVHDFDGGRIACMIARPVETNNVQVVPVYGTLPDYPGSTPPSYPYSIHAVLVIDTNPTAHTATFWYRNLDGDALCGGNPGGTNDSNSCGLHLHEGDCPAAAAAGHFWDAPATADYWKRAVGVTGGSQGAETPAYTSKVVFGSGFAAASTSTGSAGVSVVVHDQAGSRRACVPLRECGPDEQVKDHACGPCPGDSTAVNGIPKWISGPDTPCVALSSASTVGASVAFLVSAAALFF
jgi:hypothetical protein